MHLYPPFRAKVQAVLQELGKATGEPWVIAEGYRSTSRQLWLFGQGRPGVQPYGRPGQVVTWKRSPTWHGTGIAVDLMPKRGYKDVPHSHWLKLREIGKRHGLDNPAWVKGDFGHLQWSSEATRRAALDWIARGRPETGGTVEPAQPEPPIQDPGLAVLVDGVLVRDADAHWHYHQGKNTNKVLVKARPVVEALKGTIIDATRKDRILVVVDGDEPEVEGQVVELPTVLLQRGKEKEPRAYVYAGVLGEKLAEGVLLAGSGATKSVVFDSLGGAAA